MPKIIALSGPVGVGKSSFADALAKRHPIKRVSTRQLIIARKNPHQERGSLQEAGDLLDEETGGAWVADGASEAAKNCGEGIIIVMDAVRIAPQLQKLRERFGAGNVRHIHLTAPDAILEQRYRDRPAKFKEFATYAELKKSATEAVIEKLADIADVVVDASKSSPLSLATYAMAGWLAPSSPMHHLVDVIVGGQYGSEGKGNICASIARDYKVLVRIGGPNAGHRVSDPPYKYVQLPSGTGTNPGAKIIIAAGSTLWLPQLLKEIGDHPWLLQPGNLIIDEQAMIIDDEDRRIEAALLESISSTKQGVGSAVARKVIGRGSKTPFGPPVTLARDVAQLKPFLGNTKEELDRTYTAGSRFMLEGTQGTDLSLLHGSYPHVTSRETTCAGCLADAGIAPSRVRKVVMVTRTYPIRVGGDSGPMGVVTNFETIAERSGVPLKEIQETEVGTVSGRIRRIAEFDWEQLRRSAAINGATDIALTFADYLRVENRTAKSFEDLTKDTKAFITDVERVSHCPVSLISTRFAKDGVIDRRQW
jgi:adenylosuccinate synthase